MHRPTDIINAGTNGLLSTSCPVIGVVH